MIDRSFVEKICELAKPEIIMVDERPYSTKRLEAVHDPSPDAFEIHTLTGLVDFINGIDSINGQKAMLHVFSPTVVDLVGHIAGEFMKRDCFAQAKHINPTFRFGSWMDLETFIINLQAGFVPDAMTEAILKVAGNLKDETVSNFNDDGRTQAVTAKSGISMVTKVALPSPVTLQPFRTFMEIEQPASSFIFRMKQQGNGQQPACALFEADGMAWQLEAMQRIKTWLQKETTGFQVIA
ncbi:MAG: hypothetical protein ABFD97_18220 [Syntrophobacter sp.]